MQPRLLLDAHWGVGMRPLSADAQQLLHCPIAGLGEHVRALKDRDAEAALAAIVAALAHLLDEPAPTDHKGLRFEVLLTEVSPKIEGVRSIPGDIARALLPLIDLRGPWSYVAVTLACLVDNEAFAVSYLEMNLRLFGSADAELAKGMIAWRPTLQEALRSRGVGV